MWCSRLSQELKVNLFLAIVESVLMYGCEAWTMAANLTKSGDVVYTRMLRVVHQMSWRDNITNQDLYANLLKLSTKIQQRRMKFAVHCYWNSELVASQLVLWQPTHRRKNSGRQRVTYVDTLLKDTRLNTVEEVANGMGNYDVWQFVSTRGLQR